MQTVLMMMTWKTQWLIKNLNGDKGLVDRCSKDKTKLTETKLGDLVKVLSRYHKDDEEKQRHDSESQKSDQKITKKIREITMVVADCVNSTLTEHPSCVAAALHLQLRSVQNLIHVKTCPCANCQEMEMSFSFQRVL